MKAQWLLLALACAILIGACAQDEVDIHLAETAELQEEDLGPIEERTHYW